MRDELTVTINEYTAEFFYYASGGWKVVVLPSCKNIADASEIAKYSEFVNRVSEKLQNLRSSTPVVTSETDQIVLKKSTDDGSLDQYFFIIKTSFKNDIVSWKLLKDKYPIEEIILAKHNEGFKWLNTSDLTLSYFNQNVLEIEWIQHNVLA